jgi:D-alanine-D-alanine ligase-like ATP-grasp enzyme
MPLVMRLDFEDGIYLFTHGAKPNFNSTGTAKIATDKDVTVAILEELGLPTPRSHFVTIKRDKLGRTNRIQHSDEYKRLLAFAQRVDFPIFIKPNKGSQGRNVFKLRDEEGMRDVLHLMLKDAPGYFIAQEACVGEEYRIVCVQGEIILAYGRKPLSVVGNGVSTIQELVEVKLKSLIERGREVELVSHSEKIISHLAGKGMTLLTITAAGEALSVLSNRNLSDGSEPFECTNEIRAKYAQLCRDVYEKAGVDYCGLDLIEDTRSGGIKPMIIEINSNPGYKHFIRSAPENPAMVRQVFVEAIKASHAKQVILRNARRPDPHLSNVVFLNTQPQQPLPAEAILKHG